MRIGYWCRRIAVPGANPVPSCPTIGGRDMVLNTSVRRRVLVGIAITGCVIAAGIEGQAQRGGGAPAGPQVTQNVPELRFRYVGPQSAGRVGSVAGGPGDPRTYYLGAAGGGVGRRYVRGRS